MKKAIFVVMIPCLFISQLAFSAESAQYPNTRITSQGPQDAPITIIEFSNFQSTLCAEALPFLKQIMEDYSGEVRWVFKHYPVPPYNDASLAYEAALAAGEQGKFWEMHDLIFSNQSRMKRSHLLEYAEQLKLNIEKFTASLDSGKYKSVESNDIEEGYKLGVQQIPTFIVNGAKLDDIRNFTAFKASFFDGEVSPVIPPPPPFDGEVAPSEQISPFPFDDGEVAPATIPPSFPDQEQRLPPEPITLSPVRGHTEAPITIIEFSDFQSPLCARVATIINNIIEKYRGKVKWVFKHYPQDATTAHETAFAAGEQRKFWEMHDIIFSKQGEIDELDHILYATQLGLDMDRFMNDLNSERHQARINQDKEQGESMGVSEAPTFFINGKKVVGELSSSTFEAIIKEELGRLGQADSAHKAK